MKRLLAILIALSMLAITIAVAESGDGSENVSGAPETVNEQEEDTMANDTRVFQIYDEIEMRPVTFGNRYGFTLAGHLYLPENMTDEKYPAIAVAGPFGGVKEMASGLYAQEFAKMGFVALAFDQSFTGESSGTPRNAASTDINTEDYLAAVDYLGSLSCVDRERIGLMGICGLAGMAISAAAIDTRIKAVATASMYDLSRSIGKGMMDSYTQEQQDAVRDYVSQNRWKDVDAGEYSYGPHEMTVNEDNQVVLDQPDMSQLPPFVQRFVEYYFGMARHERAIGAWTQSTVQSFINFPLMQFLDRVSPRPILMIAGENAHSRYFSEDVYAQAGEPKELLIVPDADHVDMYYNMDKIPFEKLKAFFEENLK